MLRLVLPTICGLLAMVLAPLSAAQSVEHVTSSAATIAKLEEIIAGGERSDEHKARDQYRRPLETLGFFGIEPDMTVVEIWPGGQGGWYRKIIAPLIDGHGTYIPLGGRSGFPDRVDDLPYGEVDMVLVFRAHGFMIYRDPAQTYVDALYGMLRPGGIFGIVDHRGDEAIPQDPDGDNGYVNESHFMMMAEKAGFKLLASTPLNNNPKDDKDHPRGVYSLPPGLAGTRFNETAREEFLAIGESDRFTLKFYKPAD